MRSSIKVLPACMALLVMVGCAGLVRHSPLGNAAENYLRLINGNYPHDEPVPDQYIRIVE